MSGLAWVGQKLSAPTHKTTATFEMMKSTIVEYEHQSNNDGSNSGHDETNSLNSRTNGKDDETNGGTKEPTIAKKETRAVLRLKVVVLLVLVCSATIVATSVYFYLAKSEETAFRTQFKEDSKKVLDGVGSSLAKTIGLYDNLAVTLVSMARRSNQTWPFVNVPDFAIRMSKFVPLTFGVNMFMCPIVPAGKRKQWEAFTRRHDGWVNDAMSLQENWHGYYGPIVYDGIHNSVIHGDFDDVPYNVSRNLVPMWQNFPVIPNTSWTYNLDWMTLSLAQSYNVSLEKHLAAVSEPYLIPKPNDALAQAEADIWADFYALYLPPEEEPKEPMSDFVYPILADIDDIYTAVPDNVESARRSIVGLLGGSFYWRSLLRDILPQGSNGIHVVFDNACTDAFTYQINGPKVEYRGVGDLHDAKYDGQEVLGKLHEIAAYGMRDSVYSGVDLDDVRCTFTLRVYPSNVMKADYTTNNPIILAIAGLAIFVFTSVVFFIYDVSVERRQQTVMQSAVRSSAIVSSLFPEAVRDRIYPMTETGENCLVKGPEVSNPSKSNAIAELYPDTTVMFADICGFTAWSSTRQPTQVFHLLESLYAAFDEIAKRRGIFKVETIGDCYVAVAGLPTPRKGHAVVMARFANDCRDKAQELTAALEKTLGPGTANLSIRIGLNSGPTTGGVLRGEKSRFQLFGDTVNTAARMESNSLPNRIHVSQKTADLILTSGKGHWLTIRNEQISYKGKGVMTTYWCEPKAESTIQSTFVSNDDAYQDSSALDRLIGWNVDLLAGLLLEVVKNRTLQRSKSKSSLIETDEVAKSFSGKPIDEVTEVLMLKPCATDRHPIIDNIQLSDKVHAQLTTFVSSVAALYRVHPFHNFEHCCHVAMSAKKLLDRITTSKLEGQSDDCIFNRNVCGLLSDPLTHWGVMFAALVHDIDHPGVSNDQLVKDQHILAQLYQNKSAAEQNSVDIAWNLLMEPQYMDLRNYLLATEDELCQFRQVFINTVMATDLFDRDLKSKRQLRWEKSFNLLSSMGLEDTNRRATIIIELIIQASDVSHTMQHFTIYKKWNLRLLSEIYAAYMSGKSAKNPLDGWYEGELWFFDNYIIPLAHKLRDCGVFGVSCDEFLDYAKDNRMEWEIKGRDIVREAANELLVLSTPSVPTAPV